MIKKHNKDNIIRNTIFGWNIQGEIVKIYVKCKNIPAAARLQVYSEEGEEILNEIINNNDNQYYPINKIVEIHTIANESFDVVEGENGMLTTIIAPTEVIEFEEVLSTDYYFVSGQVAFKLTGLLDNERVDSVRVFYKFDTNQA